MSKKFINFVLSFYIAMFGLLITLGYAQEAEEAYDASIDSTPLISMDFKDASLKDILKAFSIQSGVNFIASQEIEDRTVTLYLDRVAIKEAMDILFKANNLDYEFYEKPKIILVKKQEPDIKTITKIFSLRYARVSASPIEDEIENILKEEEAEGEKKEVGITAVIKKLLSPQGSVIEDARTNTLIITDLPNRFPVIENTIQELDMPTPQVMLDVEILDVSKNLVDKLGFNFSDNPLTLILPGSFARSGARFFLGDLSNRGGKIGDEGVDGSLILGNTYAALLDFLKEQSETKYLARPRILTLHNETAEIKIVTQEVIGEEVQYDDQGNITSRTAERTETGVSLRITPQVNMKTGEITMFLSPKVTEAAPSEFGGTYRDPEERITKSLVRVRDGETVVAGGLIRHNKYEIIKKLPILGDIPILGLLFRHKYKSKDVERELLVFITPHIIKEPPESKTKDGSAISFSTEQIISQEEARLSNIEAALNSFDVTQK